MTVSCLTVFCVRVLCATELTYQLWVRPYSVSSGVNQSLVSDYKYDVETGEQYNCGLYIVPFNDTAGVLAFIMGRNEREHAEYCLCSIKQNIKQDNNMRQQQLLTVVLG